MFESDLIYGKVEPGDSILPSNSSYAKIARLVSPGQVVLDVGCGAGRLAQFLTDQGARVVGVERHSESAALARQFCERVIEADLSAAQPFLGDEHFDVMVFADVLEHVAQPDLVLRRLLPHLRAGGFVAASIPNVAHYSLRLRLLNGRFDYEPWGIVDRTHLRFFTRKTALALLTESGLRASVQDAVYAVPAGRLQRYWPRYPAVIGSVAPTLFAYQWILRGEKPAR